MTGGSEGLVAEELSNRVTPRLSANDQRVVALLG